MKLVFILPTFNERENIVSLIRRLVEVTKGVKNHTISYLVVDDRSPDGTEQEVAKYQKTHKNVFLLSKAKEGLGKALLDGMEYAVGTLHADILFQMDADLSHDPEKVPTFIKHIDN